MLKCVKSVEDKCKEKEKTGRDICNGLYIGCTEYDGVQPKVEVKKEVKKKGLLKGQK